jgi:hypothetical protein
MNAKTKEPISRAFKRDFPEFVDRATALGVRIQRHKPASGNRAAVYFLDNYRQLTGFTIRKDGSPFTHDDAVRNIDAALTAVEEDRRKVEGMSKSERFARVIEDARQIEPQSGMIGTVRFPSGDGCGIFFMAVYDGTVHLEGFGDVARAKVEWSNRPSEERLKLLIDRLEADYAAREAKP